MTAYPSVVPIIYRVGHSEAILPMGMCARLRVASVHCIGPPEGGST